MKRLNRLFPMGQAALLASFLAMGCNQADQSVANPASPDAAIPASSTKQDHSVRPDLGLDDPEWIQAGKKQYVDMTPDESATVKILEFLGQGPQSHVDPATLKALKTSYLAHGMPLRANNLEISYDFQTGNFKGDPSQLEVPLRKAAWWNTSYPQHRGWIWDTNNNKGYPLAFSGNAAWTGDNTGNSGPAGRLIGETVNSDIENGVTPQLSWKVLWNNGAGWTATRSWNYTNYSNDPNIYLQGVTAQSTNTKYSVCFDIVYLYSGGIGGASGCDGAKVNGPYDYTGRQLETIQITGIKFSVIAL